MSSKSKIVTRAAYSCNNESDPDDHLHGIGSEQNTDIHSITGNLENVMAFVD